MSSPDVIIVLIDQNLNLLLIPESTSTSFIKTKIVLQDYPVDNSVDVGAKNAVVRYLRDMYGFNINKARIYDPNLVTEENGSKNYIFLYKLDAAERNYLQRIPNSIFVQFNSLPSNLNMISATAALALTKNFNIVKSVPVPPNVIITYPISVIEYKPVFAVPILLPYTIYIDKRQRPAVVDKIQQAPVVPRDLVKELPVTKPTRIPSPKPTRVASPKPTRVPSPKSTRVASPKPTRVPSPKPTRVPSPKSTRVPTIKSTPKLSTYTETVKSAVKSSKPSRSPKPIESTKSSSSSNIKSSPVPKVTQKTSKPKSQSRSSPRLSRKSKKNKGGYYLKYLKYKMKYLELQRELLNTEV